MLVTMKKKKHIDIRIIKKGLAMPDYNNYKNCKIFVNIVCFPLFFVILCSVWAQYKKITKAHMHVRGPVGVSAHYGLHSSTGVVKHGGVHHSV